MMCSAMTAGKAFSSICGGNFTRRIQVLRERRTRRVALRMTRNRSTRISMLRMPTARSLTLPLLICEHGAKIFGLGEDGKIEER